MSRRHEYTKNTDLGPGDDPWSMMRHAEAVLLAQLPSWNTGNFVIEVRLRDVGGTGQYETVAEAEDAARQDGQPLIKVAVSAMERGGGRSATVSLHALNEPSHATAVVTVEGPEQAMVHGLGLGLPHVQVTGWVTRPEGLVWS